MSIKYYLGLRMQINPNFILDVDSLLKKEGFVFFPVKIEKGLKQITAKFCMPHPYK